MTAVQRARRRAAKAGKVTAPRRQRNVRPTLWDQGEFVAIDGEGFSEGEEWTRTVGVKKTLYRGKNHDYSYIAASDGSDLYSDRGRLVFRQICQFICAIRERNPQAIIVAFGGSYDVTHMLHDLDVENLRRAVGKGDGKRCIVSDDAWTYVLDYRPRKCLTIQRWPLGVRRWEIHKGKRRATPHLTVRVWDVWGFFQDTFVGVMEKWCPDDPDFRFVRAMKGDRAIFERSEIDDIKRYNAAELRILVKVMNRVRDAINDLGLKITRWDGAGAVAAAMMQKHAVKQHKGELPNEVFEAARRAYSGGHIEATVLGRFDRTVYHYDINSAYPDQFRTLPSLRAGVWIHGTDREPPGGYTLVRVEFRYPDGLPFYPLFYRCEDGAIFYPRFGAGWYWYPEYQVARNYHAQCCRTHTDSETYRFTVTQWFHFRTDETERPFGWVADYYAQRQSYIGAARRGGFESGPEKIIKLGLNALYGKTAQQVGARHDSNGILRLPPFFQLDWAGYVTAGCRARMMEAAIQKPHAVIMFATDGLFTIEPLDLYCPAEKELGAWEKQEHDGITVVMPGVYWLHDGPKIKHYSRGFDKSEMADPSFIWEAWKRGEDELPISLRRLIGIGSACSSAEFWKMRGCFVVARRFLALDGDNSKRYAFEARDGRPWLELVSLRPREHFLPNIMGVPESGPYPVAWLDGALTDKGPIRDDDDMMEWQDEIDAELA